MSRAQLENLMKDKLAVMIAKILVMQVICRHGVPKRT